MKKLLAVLLVLLAAVALVGCGSSKASTSGSFKVGMVLSGPKNDGGWSQTAFKAGEDAKKAIPGSTVWYNENTQVADAVSVMTKYAKAGANCIIGHGSEFGDAGMEVAKEFPKITFIITSTDISNGTNLGSIQNNYLQQGFLQGAFSALMYPGAKYGYVGGMQIPPIQVAGQGFSAGVNYIAKSNSSMKAFTGSFDDTNKAKEQTSTFITQGAKIVVANADNAGRGTYEACKNAKIYAIASIFPEYELYPNTLIACGVSDMQKSIYDGIMSVNKGTFVAKNYLMGVKEGIVDFTYNPKLKDKVPADVIKKMDSIKGQMKDGSLNVTKILVD